MGFSLYLSGIIFFLLFLAALRLFLCKKKNNKHGMPPEIAGGWPIIGHLHLLGEQLLHRNLAAMADKYGSIFSIRFGMNRAVVVTNWKVAKEIYTTNDKAFLTRPGSLALKHMSYENTMFGFTPYGSYWRDARKLAVSQLLSNSRLELLKHIRDTEINLFIQGLYRLYTNNETPVSVEMKERFGNLSMDIIVRIIAGTRYSQSKRYKTALDDLSRLLGRFYLSDAIPVLGWLDIVMGYVGEMKRTAKELDHVIGSWLDEHRTKQITGTMNEKDEEDFIDIMLSVMAGGEFSTRKADTVIKATCLNLILAGNETTEATLTWALSLLLNTPRVLKKLQDELDSHIGSHRKVDESDIKNLPYLQAIVKETLRLYPAAPLSGPRAAIEDCTLSGFKVLKDTRLIVNLWKLHRDPSIWNDPSEFIPERFLKHQANFDVSGQNFEYIPFGSGRRMCPGVTFTLQIVHLTLARLLHAFEVETVLKKQVDMTEAPGLLLPKATPLDVIVTPRPPAVHYVRQLKLNPQA